MSAEQTDQGQEMSAEERENAAVHRAIESARGLGHDTAMLYSRVGVDPHTAAIAASTIIAVALNALAERDKGVASELANHLAQRFIGLVNALGLRQAEEATNGAQAH